MEQVEDMQGKGALVVAACCHFLLVGWRGEAAPNTPAAACSSQLMHARLRMLECALHYTGAALKLEQAHGAPHTVLVHTRLLPAGGERAVGDAAGAVGTGPAVPAASKHAQVSGSP